MSVTYQIAVNHEWFDLCLGPKTDPEVTPSGRLVYYSEAAARVLVRDVGEWRVKPAVLTPPDMWKDKLYRSKRTGHIYTVTTQKILGSGTTVYLLRSTDDMKEVDVFDSWDVLISNWILEEVVA